MGLRNHPSSSGGSDPRLCEPAVFVEGFRSRYFPLKQWLLRHGHQASSNITWERVRHSDSHCSPSQTHCIRGSGQSPGTCVFAAHSSARATALQEPPPFIFPQQLHQASIVAHTLHVRTSHPRVHQATQGSGLPTGFSLYQLSLKPLGGGEGRASEATGT